MTRIPSMATGQLVPMVCSYEYVRVDPGTEGCARWAALREDGANTAVNQTAVDAMWAHGSPPADASNHCAQPGRALSAVDWDHEKKQAGYNGAFCFCANAARQGYDTAIPPWGLCQSAARTPEQLNVQLASEATVVLSFVTFGDGGGGDPPLAEWWADHSLTPPAAGNRTHTTGITTMYNSATPGYNAYGRASNNRSHNPLAPRHYAMHFVLLSGLLPNTKYSYRVRGGGSGCAGWDIVGGYGAGGCVWSEVHTFRAVGGAGSPTKFAMFGDMGACLVDVPGFWGTGVFRTP